MIHMVITMRAPTLFSVLATELYALKVYLSFALDALLMALVVESNLLVAVQFLSKEEECLAPKRVHMKEYQRLLSECHPVFVLFPILQMSWHTILHVLVFVWRSFIFGWVMGLPGLYMVLGRIGLELFDLLVVSV